MSSEKLDAIIFGATGFTGELVVENAINILKGFRWGVAGRNESKIKAVLSNIGEKVNKDLSNTTIIIADVNDKKSIELMAAKCKLLINCCGPYRIYGDVVVKACVENGTHHIDLSAEPLFIDEMFKKYNDLSQEKNAYVVSACGFDTIAAEMGVVFVEQNFGGTVNSIDMYWENSFGSKELSKPLFHFATWESGVDTFNTFKKSLQLQNEINRSIVDKLPSLKPKLWLNPFIHKTAGLSSYFLPFPQTDRALIHRAQRLQYKLEQKRPIQFESYVGFRSLLLALILPFHFLTIVLMSQWDWTRNLLLKCPKCFTLGIISHEGPTEAIRKAHNFQLTFKAKGWTSDELIGDKPNKEIVARVSGYDPFYGFASVALLLCAKTILTQNQLMLGTGGVWPACLAFEKTNLIEELQKHENGLQFKIIKS
ncbi:saccharopine dehydrogenase-like oxidoreductase [Teleopsis dalmanni]|uniref:saccharopine dehydrogenase-like oxidoreductase n=1 Tax=Teleopsis dalmanni TaxID=139649 RepID=UPI000D32C99F|nr:saccharopine dehydrogenase-like oxidoreductase [Teleopsis dalmanni]